MMIYIDKMDVYPLTGAQRYFLCPEPVDNRKSFDGLSAIVLKQSKEAPKFGDAFLFYVKGKAHIKVLFWTETGLTIHELPGERGERLRCKLRIAQIDGKIQ
ncbi:IS66 family insertion sequence element accessory protein TnpB [Pedobacter nutrimenti]|uniref:IS66 family insertion sequence element accessory protein TnpB n=1 Tax=Pedobacter nutrimenti TaxID=1241337 RepID=UPI0029313017|nr:IS66 family insertion sequence element accessory protein TnpB [Pedobacter nutrimenti]